MTKVYVISPYFLLVQVLEKWDYHLVKVQVGNGPHFTNWHLWSKHVFWDRHLLWSCYSLGLLLSPEEKGLGFLCVLLLGYKWNDLIFLGSLLHISFSLSVLQGLASWSQVGLSSSGVGLLLSLYAQGSSSLKSPASSALSFPPPPLGLQSSYMGRLGMKAKNGPSLLC